MNTAMIKTTDDVLDYDVDFSRWLTDTDRIAGASADIVGSAAVVDRVEFSETVVKVWISGGERDELATVTVTATTEQARTKEFCFRLRVKDCC